MHSCFIRGVMGYLDNLFEKATSNNLHILRISATSGHP